MQQIVVAIHAVPLLLLSAVLAGAAPGDAPASASGSADESASCVVCHGSPEFGVLRSDGKWVSLFVDGEEFASSVHGTQDCTSCHRNMAAAVHRREPVSDAQTRAAMETFRRVPISEPVALAACAVCHEQQFEEYRDSVHGRAALTGNADVPTCIDCHGNHYVRAADDPRSTVHPASVVNTCAACHAAEGVVAKYGVPTAQYYTYRKSYHGIANQYGSTTAANCASCHGAHNVRAPNDPLSSVYAANLPRTCGGCHRWTNPNVAKGKIHVMVTREREPLLFYVRSSFKWLTIVVMAMLCGHIAVDLFRRALSRGSR